MTMLESSTSRPTFETPILTLTPILISIILGLEVKFKAINSVSYLILRYIYLGYIIGIIVVKPLYLSNIYS
jgi:hypothetical protein